MSEFRHVLVAGSPGELGVPILRAAARQAQATGARLTVLDVVEALPARRRTVTIEGRAVDLQQMLVQERSERLRQALTDAGISDADVHVTAGRPFVEVIRHAVSNGCDLVIVGQGAPPEGGTHSVTSDVMQLLRTCPVPVWVMCPSRARKLRALALVDPDPADPARDSLNDKVLELAISLLRRNEGDLHVAHAWELTGESTLRSSAFMSVPTREVDLMVRAAADEHRLQLEGLAERHGVAELGGELHLVEGPAGEVLPELARRLDINLIVMGTVARTGLSGLIMGNTAETILRSVGCSVLTVKPDGFVSPVEGTKAR